jgi:hypothetical protein
VPVFGTDLGGIEDISPSMREVSGRRALIEDIAKRFITPRGGLWYDREYGYDLRQHLNAGGIQEGEIAQEATLEAEKDERVERAFVRVQIIGDAMNVFVRLVDPGGPVDFSLAINDVTVTLLMEG